MFGLTLQCPDYTVEHGFLTTVKLVKKMRSLTLRCCQVQYRAESDSVVSLPNAYTEAVILVPRRPKVSQG